MADKVGPLPDMGLFIMDEDYDLNLSETPDPEAPFEIIESRGSSMFQSITIQGRT